MKKFDKTELLNLSSSEKRKFYKQYRNIANRRMEDLKKAGFAKDSVLNVLRKRGEFHENYTKNNYMKLVRLLTAKTGTVSGAKKARRDRTEALRKLGLGEDILNDQDFFTYLHSNEYKTLKLRISSEEIIELYDMMYEQKYSAEQIIEALHEYVYDKKPIPIKEL